MLNLSPNRLARSVSSNRNMFDVDSSNRAGASGGASGGASSNGASVMTSTLVDN